MLTNQRVELRGLGSFKVKEYKGYTGRNPKTGETVSVQPKKLPFFRAGKELKDFMEEVINANPAVQNVNADRRVSKRAM